MLHALHFYSEALPSPVDARFWCSALMHAFNDKKLGAYVAAICVCSITLKGVLSWKFYIIIAVKDTYCFLGYLMCRGDSLVRVGI